jgi:hypothetical protein
MLLPLALARTLLIALCAAMLALAPAQARAEQIIVTVTTVTSWSTGVAEDDSDESETLAASDTDSYLLDDDGLASGPDLGTARRYAPSPALRAEQRPLSRFGPFSIVDPQTARMEGDVTSITPRQFAAMLAAFPGLRRLEMIDCPGSLDEAANLVLARAIRRAGLETIVPSGGSVRSGAVELWLAGLTRRAAPDAEFGVHSWVDENGYEARDYPDDDPVHAEYLGYYREMGMDDAKAHAFYNLTNQTPFDKVHYLTRDDMARFVALD